MVAFQLGLEFVGASHLKTWLGEDLFPGSLTWLLEDLGSVPCGPVCRMLNVLIMWWEGGREEGREGEDFSRGNFLGQKLWYFKYLISQVTFCHFCLFCYQKGVTHSSPHSRSGEVNTLREKHQWIWKPVFKTSTVVMSPLSPTCARHNLHGCMW